MARLLGFGKTSASDPTKVLSLLEKSYLNRTEGGEFNTVEEVQGLIDTLSGLPQSMEVQIKIADLENKKLQLGVKLSDILSEKNVFDTDLQMGLDNAAQANFKNMRNLIGSYATIYGDAAERYDNEVMAKISKRYGTTGTIPDETLDYRKSLQEKAKFFAQLFNSYNVIDPKTGEVGMLNPEGIAVQIDTNPTNGSVQHIDILPSGQVDEKNYMRTEVGVNVIDGMPNKKLPIYLRVNDVGVTPDGQKIRGSTLGNISYQEKINTSDSGNDTSANVLTPVKQKVGFFSKLNFLSDTPEEQVNFSIDSIKENGVSFSNESYKYDSNDVPNETVLKLGNRVFYSTGKDGQILEVTGKNSSEKNENLSRYLTGIGKDPTKILPYFITKDYLTAPDGSSRVQGKVDANYFAPPSVPTQSTSFQTTQPVATTTPEVATTTDSFFSRPSPDIRNVPNKPDAPVETSGFQMPSVPDIIEKGKSFFRNRVQ